MRILITQMLLAFTLISFQSHGQSRNFKSGLHDLPVEISWDDYGVIIKAKNNQSDGFEFGITASPYLEQLGNNILRVKVGSGKTPTIIDFSNYYQTTQEKEQDFNIMTSYQEAKKPSINVEMPKFTLANYDEPNSFALNLLNYSEAGRFTQQTFLIRGLDLLYVNIDECGKLSLSDRTIVIDVNKCKTKFMLLKGGLLNLNDIKKVIPDLCRKYNNRYYIKEDAFITRMDSRRGDEKAVENLKHVRGLITKYGITDFEDEPIAFLSDILLTKKGVGINLKAMEDNEAKLANKKIAYEAMDSYIFFDWFEYTNLSFQKYIDDKKLKVNDPFGRSYIFNSNIVLTNVELIQFFNELKSVISTNVY